MKYQDEINKLDELSYRVTQENGTEQPFNNKYNNNFAKGLYIDIISKVPLFTSNQKFECSCGWPSFFSEIDENELLLIRDTSHGMDRIEVRAKESNAHLGHLFHDGQAIYDYKRYCINSAALEFVEYDKLNENQLFIFNQDKYSK